MIKSSFVALMLVLVSLAAATLAAEDASLAPDAPMDYAPFAMEPKAWKDLGVSLELTPWMGKNVVFLTTSPDLDHRLMAYWVAQLDAGWQAYADLTGRSPKPFHQFRGRATIAAVPKYDLTCGAGCGYIGETGIELAMFYDTNYPALKTHPKTIPHYVYYEMGRNFYTFGDRHSCFITGFAVFMRYVCMDRTHSEDIEGHAREIIEGVEPRFAKSGLSFLDLFTNTTWKNEKASRIKDADGQLIEPSDQPVCYASAMLRLRRDNGGDAWVKRFFEQLADCPEFPPETEAGALRQGMYWLLSASVAARKDLSSVFADEWHYPLNPRERTLLSQTDWKQQGLTAKSLGEKLLAKP